MMENRGQLTLAHSDAAIRSFRWRAEVNQHLGVRSELIDRQTIADLVPNLNMSEDVRFPIMAGLWHADGATARHDAVAWGYAKGACERGVELHQLTEVEDIEIIAWASNRGQRLIVVVSNVAQWCRRLPARVLWWRKKPVFRYRSIATRYRPWSPNPTSLF